MIESRASRLGKNTLLVFLGNIGAKIIGLLMLPFYTRWLSVEDYGLTDILSVYVSFLIGIVTCCIGESLFIFPKGVEKKEQRRYITSGLFFIIFTLSATAVIFVILRFLFDFLNVQNSFSNNIWLVYFMLVSQIFQQITQQINRSIDKMKVYSLTGVVCTVLTAILGFLLTPLFGFKGVIWSAVIANILAGFYSIFSSKLYLLIDVREINKDYLVKMLRYSIPLIPNGIMWWLVSALNRPLMEHHLGLHDMGIFAVANKIPGILSMIFTIFATSWQISVLEEFGKTDYNSFYNRIFKMVFGLLLIVFLGLTIFSKFIIGVFAADDFYEAWKYAPLLTLGVLFSNISSFVGSNFSATRESKYYFYSSVWGAVTAIALNFILIPVLGIWGACISVGVSFIVMSLSRVAYAWKYVRINGSIRYIIVLTISILFMLLYIFDASLKYTLIMFVLSMGSLIIFERKELLLLCNMLKTKLLKH